MTKKNKISKDVALKELDNFLFNVKKLDKNQLLNGSYGEYARNDYLGLIADISAGHFYFKDDKAVQVLQFPCGDEKELVYEPRLKAKDLSRLAAYHLNDSEGRKREIAAIITGQAIGIIGDMDSLDFERSKRLTEFYFLA